MEQRLVQLQAWVHQREKSEKIPVHIPLTIQHPLRMENERYLRNHPEIKELTLYFIKRCLLEQPKDLSTFAAEFFCDPCLAQKLTLTN